MKKSNQSKKSKQLGFFENKTKTFFGGQCLKGKRKSQRPLDSQKALHLVFKVAAHVPSLRLPRNHSPIEKILKTKAEAKGIRIYLMSIQTTHIHLLIKIHNRDLYVQFIRAVTGMIAMHMGGGKKGCMCKKKVFPLRPFSRVLNWGNDYKNVMSYLLKNTLEAIGFIPYTKRTNWYAGYLRNEESSA